MKESNINIRNQDDFIKNVESLIDPMEISSLLFFQKFKKLLPRAFFKKLLKKTSQKTPQMGFAIEPYSLFLFFKIHDVRKAQSLLPERYELVKAPVFEGDEPDYYFGIGNLNTRGSTFWGVRLESYVIARDLNTGLISWIFFDILSNTIIAVPSEGIADPNSRSAIFTTSSGGNIHLNIKDDHSERQLTLKGNLNRGKMRKPDQELWVMGNTSIGHIKDLSDYGDDPFAVIFDPAEVGQALHLPLDDVTVIKNTLVPDFAEKSPCLIACFPFTQHYIADSPGCRTHVKSIDDLIEKHNRVAESQNIKTFSTKSLSRIFVFGMIVSPVVSFILLVLLMMKR